jgi:plasmid stabilization system protein ParE
VPELFAELPGNAKRHAAQCIDLLSLQPRMYPVRRRGVMRGYRYFLAGRFLFYYSVTSTEVRISAIIPAAMLLA